MALPLTRNTTYAPGSPVKSADLNAMQDQIIANYDRLWLDWDRYNINFDNAGIVDTVSPFAGFAARDLENNNTPKFVAATNQKLYNSFDGQFWEEAISYGSWSCVSGVQHAGKIVLWCERLGLFVACGSTDGFSIATSEDGRTWTAQTDPGPVASFLQRGPIIDNGAILVTCHPGASGGFMTSTNGTTWTLRTNPAANKVIRDIAWSPSLSLFCAINATGSRITSPDGITWTDRGNSIGGTPQAITWSAQHAVFVAAGNGVIQRSANGIAWTSVIGDADGALSLLSDGPAIYGLGLYLVRSMDGGLTWAATNALAVNDGWHAVLKADGGRLAAFGGKDYAGVVHQMVAMTPKLTP